MMDNEYIYGKNDLFALIIIINSFLKEEEVKSLVLELEAAISNLEYNLRSIPVAKVLDTMGFPENWSDIQNIAKKELF